MEVSNADLVGKHFVNHYYPNLFDKPHTIHQYYTNESRLIRVEAGPMGNTWNAKSIDEIHRAVMSLDHKNCKAEILSVDSLDSVSGSIFVLVTGAIQKDDIRQKFVQGFYLCPGNGKYFVINDIFRYLDEETQMAAPSVDRESEDTYDNSHMATTVPEASGEEAYLPQFSDHFKEFVDSKQLDTEDVITQAFSPVNLRSFEGFSLQDDVQSPPFEAPVEKRSYAAILQSDNHTSSQTAVAFHQPVSNPKQSLSYQHSSRARAPTKAKQEPVPVEKKVDLRSVFVRNLPANIMNRQLENEMSRFGPLQPNKICLKTNQSGLMYAFVDFTDSTSAQAAIEASPILIGGRQVRIEKRTSVYHGDRGRGHGRR